MSNDMASGEESGDGREETPLVVLGCGWTWTEGELMVSTMGEIETTSRDNPGRR